LKFKTKPRWNLKWNIAFSSTWRAANLNEYFIFIFFRSVDNETIVSFKFFEPKITHLYIYVWNFKRNPIETPKEMSHFHLLEGPQIWMTFCFYFFHSVENEKIVSFKFFRPKITHSFVLGWNFKRNLVETPNEGPQIWMTLCFNFFS
jgi:hypothetical protein